MTTVTNRPEAHGSEAPAKLVNLLLRYFRGREDAAAVQNGKAFNPQPLNGQVTLNDLIDRHLQGDRCAGFYLMMLDNKVWCAAVDFDNKPKRPDPLWRDKAEATYHELCRLGLSPLLEVSQSGEAAHVWLFFDEPVPAWIVRKFLTGVSGKMESKFEESFR